MTPFPQTPPPSMEHRSDQEPRKDPLTFTVYADDEKVVAFYESIAEDPLMRRHFWAAVERITQAVANGDPMPGPPDWGEILKSWEDCPVPECEHDHSTEVNHHRPWHKIETSTSGMSKHCTEPGCDWSYEYD
jgi:hypothetical protein